MILKISIIVLLLLAFIYLIMALKSLVSSEEKDRVNLQKQLAWRFSLCFLAFLILMFAFYKGYITPHNLS